MKSNLNDDYIEYKMKFSPILWSQEINKDKADKLFIIIDDQIPTSRLIDWYNFFGVIYKFDLPILGSIVSNVALKQQN